MTKKHDHFQEFLEWELLESNEAVSNLTFVNGIYKLEKDCIITFSRNNQFDLTAIISGIATNPNDLKPNIDMVIGTFISSETITGFSKENHFKYSFDGIVLGATKFSPVSTSSTSVKFQAELIVDRIEKVFILQDNETEKIQEWYLSGNCKVNYTGTTERSIDKSYKRLRNGIDLENDINTIQGSGISRDYNFIQLPEFSFIIAKVPKEFEPVWSYNLSIEYRKTFGKIPDIEEREAISELVSFILGTQLLKIGESHYDDISNLIKQEFKNPWGDNIVNKCKKNAIPPVEIGNYNDWDRIIILLTELLPEYLIKRKSLRLKDTLWKYWLAKDSILGANLPILSSAVETLADQILKEHPEIKQYYLEYNLFSDLIKDEIIAIENKIIKAFEQINQKDKIDMIKESILRKIKGASQRGANEKLKMMFEIIDLPIGKIEKKALTARNKMAHSSLGETNIEEIKDTMRMTRAYETLFHRIFLKILNYKGNYIDYYSVGHPNRNINESIIE